MVSGPRNPINGLVLVSAIDPLKNIGKGVLELAGAVLA